MALPIVSLFQRHYFARSASNGEPVDFASLDGQTADLVEGHNQVKARLDAISTSAGSLKFSLVSINTITATAAQTAFTVTTYDITAGASFALAWSGSNIIPQASISLTSATVITLPAQTVGTVVTIAIFGSGNGTSQLASTTVGQGASLIGINDAASIITATTVEVALQEIATNLASSTYLAGVLTLANWIKKDGTVAFTANQPMGGFKLTGLAAGTANGDSVRYEQVQSAALLATLNPTLSASYLALTGGTLTGALAMSNQFITGLPAATATGQAVRYDELIAHPASYVTSGTMAVARLPVMVGAGASNGTAGLVPAPLIANATYVLYGNGTWGAIAAALGSGYILITQTVASGGAAPVATAATWNATNINTIVADTATMCTIGANQIVLQPGTYRFRASEVAYQANLHQMRLRNITDGVTIAMGKSCNSSSGDFTGTTAELMTRFTIAAVKTIAVQHYTSSGGAFGTPVTSGENEVYATVEMWRE